MKTRWMITLLAAVLMGCGADTESTEPETETRMPTDAGVALDTEDESDRADVDRSDDASDPEPGDDTGSPVDMAPPAYGEWFRNFGGGDADIVESVATDDRGNVYVAGSFRETMVVGGESLTAVEAEHNPTTDVFVASWGPSGEFRWANSFGSPEDDQPAGIAVGPEGGVFVVGNSQGELKFGSSVLPHKGQMDLFAVKFDREGEYRWSQSWGGRYSEMATAITVNEGGDLFITGSWQGLFTAGDTTFSAEMDLSAHEVLVMSVDGATGGVNWANSFNGFLSDVGTAIDADSKGHVVVGVSMQYDLDVGDHAFDTGDDNFDAVIVRMDSTGRVVWATQLGTPDGNEEVKGVALSEDIYATGVFEGTVNLGGDDLVNSVPGHDVFVLGLDADGEHVFSSSYGGEGFDQPLGMAAREGELYVAGRFDGRIAFSDTELQATSDAYDIFVTSFETESGAVRWARGFGGAMDDQPNGIAVDPWSGVYVAGYGDGDGFMFNGEMQPAASDWLDGVVFRLEE